MAVGRAPCRRQWLAAVGSSSGRLQYQPDRTGKLHRRRARVGKYGLPDSKRTTACHRDAATLRSFTGALLFGLGGHHSAGPSVDRGHTLACSGLLDIGDGSRRPPRPGLLADRPRPRLRFPAGCRRTRTRTCEQGAHAWRTVTHIWPAACASPVSTGLSVPLDRMPLGYFPRVPDASQRRQFRGNGKPKSFMRTFQLPRTIAITRPMSSVSACCRICGTYCACICFAGASRFWKVSRSIAAFITRPPA